MAIPTPQVPQNPTYSQVGFLLPDNSPDVREVITGLLLSCLDANFWQQNAKAGTLTIDDTIAIFTVIFESWIGD